MKSFYYFLVGISLLAFGFSGVATSIDAHLGLVYKENPSPKKQDKPQPKKNKKGYAQNTHFSLLTGEITTTDAFALALPPTITATKSVAVQGGGNAVPGSQLNYTIVINNAGTDATGVALNDVLVNDLTLVAGSVKATPIIVDDSYDCIGNVGITVPAISGLLANDIDPLNKVLQATAVNQAGTQGTVVANPDGSFTFTPVAGYSGTTTFTYTASNGNFASTATVSIVVSAPIWFVNIAAASNGTGTLASPFKDWSDFATSNALSGATNPAASQTVFVYSGTYTGAATLKTGQKILGKGATTTLASFAGIATIPTFSNTLPATSGTSPTLTSGGTTITLGSGNSLRGFDMGNSVYDIAGTSFGTLTASEMTLNGTGATVDLSTGAVTANFTSISSTNAPAGATNGVLRLNSVTGTFTSGSTTITNPTTAYGLQVLNGSTVTASFGNTSITGVTAVSILLTGGTSNTSSITFADLDITCTSAQAINTNHVGSFTCTSGTIITSIGNGMILGGPSTANKETLNMVLTSYSASGSSKGMTIANTSGSFAINGTGTTAGSGGTINNFLQRGVEFNNCSNITLKNMNFTNANTTAGSSSATDYSTANGAITLNNVSGVTLTKIAISGTTKERGITGKTISNFTLNGGSTITDCGDGVNEGCLYLQELTGTCTITDAILSKGSENIARVFNSTGTLTLNIGEVGKTTTFDNTQVQNANYAVPGALSAERSYCFIYTSNDAASTAIATLNVRNSNFTKAGTHGFKVISNGNATSKTTVNIKDCVLDNTNAAIAPNDAAGGIELTTGGNSYMPFNILNNTITGHGIAIVNISSIGVGAADLCKAEGRINGNTITCTLDEAGDGIDLTADSNGDVIAEVNNNIVNINGVPGTVGSRIGIFALSRNGTGQMDATITNNTVTVADPGASHNIQINAGASSGTTTNVTCANVANNTTSRPDLVNGVNYRVRRITTGTYVMNLVNNAVAATAWSANGNTPSAAANVAQASTATAVAGCLTVGNPVYNSVVITSPVAESISKVLEENTVIDDTKTEETEEKPEEIQAKPSTESTSSSARIMAGETVTVNGAGSGFSLPAGKSTTVTFSATVSTTPSTCAITNQASVSGSNFTTITSNTTTTNLIVPPINAGSTISATSVCSGGTITLGAACPSGSQLKWFTASSGGSSVSTISPFSPTNITAPTSYYASCTIGSCESVRTLVGSVTINPLPIPNPSSNSPVCSGNTLSLQSAASSTYSWTGPNSFTSTQQNPSVSLVTTLAQGTYTITQTTSLGCTASATIAIVINASPTATASSSSATICAGATINLIGGNAVAGNTYAWAGPLSFVSTSQSPSITNALTGATGVYTITVTNTANCSARATTSVTVNAVPTATASSPLNICAGTNLALTGGGVGTYAWAGPNSFTSTAQSPTITDATTSSTGTYTLTVTNANSCTSTATTSVTVNAIPIATASSNSPVIVGNTLTLSSSGGGTYLWAGPNTFTSTAQNPTVNSATLAASGTYTVTIANAGCTATATTAVSVVTASANSNSPICAGNTLNLTSSGGGTYAWAGPNSFTSTDQNPSIANATIAVNGVYTVIVTNGVNTVAITTSVTVNAVPTATANSSSPICAGNTISLIGEGIGNYAWTGPNSYSSTSQSPTIANATTLATGVYTITVTNANSCTSTATTSVTVNALPTATASSNTPITCAGNTISLTGVGIGTYAWAGPNSYASTVQSPTIPNASTLATGVYTLTVINANSCTSTATTSVTVNALPTATASSNSPICAGTTLNLSAGGAAPALIPSNTFAWAGPNSFSSTLQNPSILSATTLATGIYTLTVTNANSCTSTATTSVTVNALPTATASSSTPVICVGNTISLSGGGIGTYAWTGVNGFSSTDQNPSIPNATLLASGTYKITLTNANSCTSTATTSVTVNAIPTATASSSTPIICAGNSISLTGGGVGTYAWAGPNSYASTVQSPTIANATILATGVYTLTVTNANNCTSTATTSVTVNALPTATASSNSPLCVGNTISLTGGGIGTYAWSGPNSYASTVQSPTIANATILATGIYTLRVTNDNNCTAIATTSVTVNTTPTATASSSTPVICAGNSISLTAGGVGSYSWAGPNSYASTVQSPTIANANTLATGVYTLTVTNANSCTSTATTSVTVNALPTATANSNSPICSGATLNLLGGGGTAYAWAGPNSYASTLQNPSITNVTTLATGIYTISVTDANSCTSTATTSVTVNALPTATASSNSPICSGATLNLLGGGGTAYAWAGPNSYASTLQNPSITNATTLLSGIYTISVMNANGCTSTATTSVTVNPVVVVPTPQANTQIIFGASITLTATGCSGVNDLLKWYQSADNTLAVMPVSPTATTNYYAKCETTLNGITCISGNSANVTVTVLSPNPPVATGATNCLGTPTTLTATGCSGSVGTFVLKWYQNADDVLVIMPVSPLVSTDYYAKCEQTFNSVTAVSTKSNVVTLTILNPPTPVATGGTIYNSQSITLNATGCAGTLGTFTLRWYQSSDNASVNMPVSPTVTTQYYAKCEQTANAITCLSSKSNDVTVTVVNRIFVDITKIAAPIQNGNSWATAYGNLQTGLAAATPGIEVWVAKGTYKPTNTLTRTIYFNIPNNVIVYGGFAGTEDNLIDRNFRTNLTVLSGDIGTQNLMDDNSYHVVTFSGSSNSTILDGFTITGGNASFDPKVNGLPLANNNNVTNPPNGVPTQTGGGILIDNAGKPIITNCIINKNTAWFGGGIFCLDSSTPSIQACDISNNEATFGGAIYAHNASHFTMKNVLMVSSPLMPQPFLIGDNLD